jgi:hypothetical protein
MTNKTNLWLGGTVVAVLAILGIGWMLLVGPAFDSVSETNALVDEVEDQNTALRAQTNTLRAQFQNIDTLQAELEVLQTQIPDALGMDTYLKQVSDLAEANGTFVGKVVVSDPVALVAPTPAPAAPADGSATAAQPPAAPVSKAVAVPVSIEILGSRDAVLSTVAGLQGVDQRLFLVSRLDGDITKERAASGGYPAMNAGDLLMTVQGYVFVQPPTP